MTSKPPVSGDLTWTGDLTFAVATKGAHMTLDGANISGPSPVEALAASLVGCLSADVTFVLTRGRHPLRQDIEFAVTLALVDQDALG